MAELTLDILGRNLKQKLGLRVRGQIQRLGAHDSGLSLDLDTQTQPGSLGLWRRFGQTVTASLVRRAHVAHRAGASDKQASQAHEVRTGSVDGTTLLKPLTPIPNEGHLSQVVLVVVLGLTDEELDAAIDAVDAQRHPEPVVPIFLTDSCAFGKFRSRHLLFEYHPASSCHARTISSIDWELFERRRLQLLVAKWQPLRIIAFGAEARACLDRWQVEEKWCDHSEPAT